MKSLTQKKKKKSCVTICFPESLEKNNKPYLKGFLSLSGMKGIGYFQNLGNVFGACFWNSLGIDLFCQDFGFCQDFVSMHKVGIRKADEI